MTAGSHPCRIEITLWKSKGEKIWYIFNVIRQYINTYHQLGEEHGMDSLICLPVFLSSRRWWMFISSMSSEPYAAVYPASGFWVTIKIRIGLKSLIQMHLVLKSALDVHIVFLSSFLSNHSASDSCYSLDSNWNEKLLNKENKCTKH